MLPCAAINRLHCRPRFITSKQKQRNIPLDISMAIAAQGISTAIQHAEDVLRSYKSASQLSPVSTEATETICGRRHGATVAENYDFKAGRCARYPDLRKRLLMSNLLVMSEHTSHIQDG